MHDVFLESVALFVENALDIYFERFFVQHSPQDVGFVQQSFQERLCVDFRFLNEVLVLGILHEFRY